MSLFQEIRTLIALWAPHVKGATAIFIRTPKHSRTVFVGGKKSVFSKDDPRIRRIPFVTRRPTLREVKRVHAQLSSIFIMKSVSTATITIGDTPVAQSDARREEVEEVEGKEEEVEGKEEEEEGRREIQGAVGGVLVAVVGSGDGDVGGGDGDVGGGDCDMCDSGVEEEEEEKEGEMGKWKHIYMKKRKEKRKTSRFPPTISPSLPDNIKRLLRVCEQGGCDGVAGESVKSGEGEGVKCEEVRCEEWEGVRCEEGEGVKSVEGEGVKAEEVLVNILKDLKLSPVYYQDLNNSAAVEQANSGHVCPGQTSSGQDDSGRCASGHEAAVVLNTLYSGTSALHIASACGHAELVAVLLQYGADPTIRCSMREWQYE